VNGDVIVENRRDPIFIQGILPRSGTNFLWQLLLLHPDCAPAVEPVHEDLFLDHSEHLVAFARAVRGAWDPGWGDFGADLPARLQAALGEGLVSFLWADRTRRLVTKSPSVRHLKRFFDFFPTAHLVILIRDGRSVAQSCMDTFGWTFERAVREWANAAIEIDQFRHANAHRASRWRLVRYEDLLDNLDVEVPSLLQFAGLDAARYDFDAARNLPIRGSSVFFGPGRSAVHWDPVEKNRGFAPKERWRSWSPHRLERFEWLAGDQLRAFGYATRPAARRAFVMTTRHLLVDAAWAARRVARRTRTRLGSAFRPLRRHLGLVR
jgi:protein-tyrosine sulfotransferase